MRHIVIIRLSGITDVAIAAPLVRAYAKANPDVLFTMVSIPFMDPLFEDIPNLKYQSIVINEENTKIKDVFNITQKIIRIKPTSIADFSNTSLSNAICMIFKIKGIDVKCVKDPRKFALNTPHIQSRFENVLTELGLQNLFFHKCKTSQSQKIKYTFHRIGIAPFAKYEGKTWPSKNMEEVVAELSKDNNNKIYLFGDRSYEAKILQGWGFKYQNCESIAGKYTIREELDLIRSLDVMVTMDSANMHFASFVQTPVISIWGATHPDLGYYGCGQEKNHAIGIDLDCRPCSLYGEAKCSREDYACLKGITPNMVLEKINNFYNHEEKQL